MLWRFFGVWGRCCRSGAVVILNLDFQTGGRIKNLAFARGVQAGFDNMVYDVSWTLEARHDAQMPERLAVVMASEGAGVSEAMLSACDRRVYLPMVRLRAAAPPLTPGGAMPPPAPSRAPFPRSRREPCAEPPCLRASGVTLV